MLRKPRRPRREFCSSAGDGFDVGDSRYLAGLRDPKRRKIDNRPWETTFNTASAAGLVRVNAARWRSRRRG